MGQIGICCMSRERIYMLQDCPQKQGNKALICVAGLASSALEGCVFDWKAFANEGHQAAVNKLKSHKKYNASMQSRLKQESFMVNYCSIEALATEPHTTLKGLWLELTEGELYSGDTAPCMANSPGIDVRPVQGMTGIRTLNPGELFPIDVWSGLTAKLEDQFNFIAFNYDWRRWGDEVYSEQLVYMFKDRVESTVLREGPRAALIGHSMGCSVILYCLAKLGKDWQHMYIDRVIFVAPAHTGSPCMIPSLAHDPVHATNGGIMPVPSFIEHEVGDLCASWPCMAAELPMAVGGIRPCDHWEILVSAPNRNYYLKDMAAFVKGLADNVPNREVPTAMWKGIERMAATMAAPAVSTFIFYSKGLDTIASVEYTNEDWWRSAPEVRSTKPGDGTIVADHIETVTDEWKRKGAHVEMILVEGEVSHKDLICCKALVERLPSIMTKRILV